MSGTKICILGAGPGGYVAAVRAAQLGAEVTIVEKENLGGTCLNWGCIPSKVLIKTASLMENFKKADTFGLALADTPKPDMARLMARKNTIIETQIQGIGALLKRHGIRHLPGRGRIQGPGLVAVEPIDGEMMTVAWDRLIIATGTRPLNVAAMAFDGKQILSSNHALSLQSVPESVLIVGGGVIGCEFACMLSGLGAQVTVVEALDRLLPLPSVDADCSKVLQREMKKKKINFLLGKTVTGVESIDGRLQAAIGPSPFLESPPGNPASPLKVAVDKMLVCIGRKANSDDIGLETIGLKTDERGWIQTDSAMRTQVKHVYAIGDILGPSKIMLAHVASTEGEVAAENAMGHAKTMAYDVVPSGIFTSPEVAGVGLTEAQAKDRGIDCRADSVLFRNLGKAQVIGEISGQAKIISETATGRVLGAHIIGAHATDLVAEGTLAIKLGARVKDLAETIHAHPTLSEIYLETSLKAIDYPLHG